MSDTKINVNAAERTSVKGILEEIETPKITTPEIKLGELIYLKRCKLRWSQGELAEYANRNGVVFLSQQRISYIEKGCKVYWVEICAIAQAFGLSLDEFSI